MAELDQDRVVAVLNRILEAELAGVVRYTHYSLLVFGFARIPIVSWLRDQAAEAAAIAGAGAAVPARELGSEHIAGAAAFRRRI